MNFKLLTVICLLLIGCKKPQEKISFREYVAPTLPSISPTISSIFHLRGNELQYAIDSLLTSKSGFPLVEKDPYFDDYYYVTFLYSSDSPLTTVRLNVFGNGDRNLDKQKLEKLHGSNLYYYTLMLPPDICFSYRFELIDSLHNHSETIVDPFNANHIPFGEVEDFSWSVFDLNVHQAKWNTQQIDQIQGQVDTLHYPSKILQNSRNIYVYMPDGYTPARPEKYPVIYLFDSFIYLNRIQVPNILDNLTKEGKIEPIVAVLIDNPTEYSRFTELPMNPDFQEFVVKELVPDIRKIYHVSSDKNKNIIGGMSYGGLCAAYIAFNHDEIFGKVLSNSGSFWRDTISHINTEDQLINDYLTKQFLTQEKKDLTFYLDWGLQEYKCFHSNKRFVKVLDSLDYKFSFAEFNGWHDWANTRKTFPTGLMYLLNDN